MRQHCISLERLVMMGLSPQAARVAMRHLDAWVVGDSGRAEMAAADQIAAATGESVLRIGQRVQLGGLVKNPTANGKTGTLYAYRAEDLRWKVYTGDGKIYWLQPKFVKSLEPDKQVEEHSASTDPGLDKLRPSAGELAAGWAKFEAKKVLWTENLESQEIALLEREAQLLRDQEAMASQLMLLEERRRSLALEQAQVERRLSDQSASERQQNTPRASVEHSSFSMCGGEHGHEELQVVLNEESSEFPCDARSLGDSDEDDGEDEVWDTDWAALSSPAEAPNSEMTSSLEQDNSSVTECTPEAQPVANLDQDSDSRNL